MKVLFINLFCASMSTAFSFSIQNVKMTFSKYHFAFKRTTSNLYSTIGPIQNDEVRNETASDTASKKRRDRVKTHADLRWEIRPIGVIESPYVQKYGKKLGYSISFTYCNNKKI